MNDAIGAMLFLTIALVIPLGIDAQTTFGDGAEADSVDHAGGAYVELLKQQDEFLNMTEWEQAVYIERAIDFINSDDPYENARNQLLQKMSAAVLELQKTTDEEKRKQIQDQIDDILGQLEELGVVSADRLEDNEQFYVDKYDEAKDQLNDDMPTLTPDVDYNYSSGDMSLYNAATYYFHALLQSLAIQLHVLLEQVVVILEQIARILGLSHTAQR